jgi:tripartite-type tricarboxylate transporter receptor subunit TctC
MFVNTAASIEYIRAGRLRALAVTTATRSEALPDIPTVSEFVPGYEASGWSGVGSPKSTPTEVIDKLDREINTALADPKIKEQLADLGAIVFVFRPQYFPNSQPRAASPASATSSRKRGSIHGSFISRLF